MNKKIKFTKINKKNIGRFRTQIILIIITIIMAFPFFFLFKLSIQPDADVLTVPMKIFPSRILWFTNYIKALQKFPIATQFLNSCIYSITTSIFVVLTGAFSSYALAKLKIPGTSILLIFFVSTILIPPEMRAVPMYTMMAELKWVDTWKGMIIPLSATGFSIFFLYQFMITIPDELIEAARIDGASEFMIFWRIILPMSRTAIGTMALYNFLFRWNCYIWPLLMTKGRVTTLSVGIASFKTSGEQLIHWNIIGAATMFLFIPSLILFIGLRSYIMKAVSFELK